MYFLMIVPQKKQDKKMQEMLSNLEIGDEVTTVGGIVGRLISTKDDTVLIETGNGSKIRFVRGAIKEVNKLEIE